jgi:hypothetical protein
VRAEPYIFLTYGDCISTSVTCRAEMPVLHDERSNLVNISAGFRSSYQKINTLDLWHGACIGYRRIEIMQSSRSQGRPSLTSAS